MPVKTAPQRHLMGHIDGPALHVMSWNIRRKMPACTLRAADQWQIRAPRLQALLRAERPSLLGVQEAMDEQSSFVAEALGEQYSFVGHGRNADGGGERSPIFYDAARLKLLSWEQLALSNEPHRPGSRSWGNMIPRILVAATFQDRVTSGQFLAINTHFDHVSRNSRLLSARAIQQLVAQKSLPSVVTGDFNAGATSAPIRELLTAGKLKDSWAVARTRETREWGTFPNYQAPRLGRKRIDWVMVTPNVEVLRAAINPERYIGGWASDHLPVQTVLKFPGGIERP